MHWWIRSRVHRASGGVGTAAIQLMKEWGAGEIAAVCRSSLCLSVTLFSLSVSSLHLSHSLYFFLSRSLSPSSLHLSLFHLSFHLFTHSPRSSFCSGKNEEFVRGLGATVTMDYTKSKITDAFGKAHFDMVFDCASGWCICLFQLKLKRGRPELKTTLGEPRIRRIIWASFLCRHILLFDLLLV